MKFSKSIHYVSSALASLEFYKNAFGFEISYLHESKEYGELKTGETILAFATKEQKEEKNTDNTNNNQNIVELQFVVDDVISIFEKAIALGGIALKNPIEKPSGQMVALLKTADDTFVELITPEKD